MLRDSVAHDGILGNVGCFPGFWLATSFQQLRLETL